MGRNHHLVTAGWVALAVAYVAIFAISTLGWSQGARAGIDVTFDLEGRAVISEVVPRGYAWDFGVPEGSVLLEINGLPATRELWAEIGETADTLMFRTPSGDVIEAGIAEHRAVELPGMVSVQLTGAVFALASLFVISRAWRSNEAITFSFFALLTAILMASVPGSDSGQFFSEVVFGITLLWVSVAFVGSFLTLDQSTAHRSARLFPRWIYSLPLGAGVLTIVAILRFTLAPDLSNVAVLGTLMFVAATLLLGLALLARRYMRSKSEIFREQIRVITVGTTIAVLPVVLLSVIPNAAGSEPFVPPEILLTATIVIPLSFGYAILRHELLGIRRLVHRGVAYVLISALVVSLYAAALGATRIWANEGLGDKTAVNIAVLVALLGIPLIPRVREIAFSIVDRLLYRDFMDHREVVRGVSLEAVETSTVGELLDSVLHRIREPLGVSFAAYIEYDAAGGRTLWQAGAVEERVLDSLYAAATQGNGIDSRTRVVTDPSVEGQVVLTILPGGAQWPAAICVGPKETGEPFSDEDVQMIQTICGLASTAVARLRLLDELQEKNEELIGLNRRLIEVEEEERARISGYLHDEPLQKVAYVLAQYRERNQGADLIGVLDDAVRDLRNISATLSPAVLSDLGLTRAVEWLISETETRVDFRIEFHVEGESREKKLPASAELVTYRLVQEALTNCQKHSKASAVWVSMEFEDEGLLITVEDNGVGVPGGPDGSLRKADSLGLLSMRQRVESQNGFLAVENRRSRGFSVRARLPYRREPARDGSGLRAATG